ncbi:hypothetical protein SCLCIDRAFT_23874 [Scleroderma citrinum Foug A]|uniref:Transmembrane protein n=1 Tax=Scleroderma citrinum Foug A TaxID=1036808 RepID=A0A0C3AGH4_9AGAM|nr:hypothetical protein SCLCIDRAFT_23874 [Scleroderma citrinum Foug A]
MASALHLHSRNIVSNVTCVAGFNWMNNQEQKDPCLLVAYVIAACVGNSWTQPALPPGSTYSLPSNSTATRCYCSWSCYNLMMACTWCQNPGGIGLSSWINFSQNCPSGYTDEYFPSGFTLSANQTIPYWASIDPKQWTSGIFDVNQAKQYDNEGQPALDPGVSSGSRSSDFGPVVGGTVGGVVLVIILAIGICCFCKRRRYNRLVTAPHAGPRSDQSVSFSQSRSVLSPPPMSYFTGVHSSSFPAIPPPHIDAPSYTTRGLQLPAIPIV